MYFGFVKQSFSVKFIVFSNFFTWLQAVKSIHIFKSDLKLRILKQIAREIFIYLSGSMNKPTTLRVPLPYQGGIILRLRNSTLIRGAARGASGVCIQKKSSES